jgi:hypothetical protein
MSYIEVERRDYPARKIKYRYGRIKEVPARYEVVYKHNGKEIASYDSRYDTIYINDDYADQGVKTDRKSWDEWCQKTPYEKAITCPNHEVYEYLFAMLKVDETTHLSEKMSAY